MLVSGIGALASVGVVVGIGLAVDIQFIYYVNAETISN